MSEVLKAAIGAALFVGPICYFVGVCHGASLEEPDETTSIIQAESVLQQHDLNGNGIPEQFYEIDGRRVYLSIDGECLDDRFIKP